jgi:hypothetical protein
MIWLISNLMHKILIYLYIINLLKSFTCFEHYPAHLQEVFVVIVYMQPLLSSLSACDCSVHRLRTGNLQRSKFFFLPPPPYQYGSASQCNPPRGLFRFSF